MVDDRAMRFQGVKPSYDRIQRQQTNKLDLNDFVSGFLRNQVIGAEERAKGIGTGVADLAVRKGVPDSAGLRVAAFLGDFLVPASLGIGARVSSGLASRKAQKVAEKFWKNNSDLQNSSKEMLDAILRKTNLPNN